MRSVVFWQPFRLVVLREILLSKRQWLVFAVTGAFFAMTWLFQVYLNAYHTRFIAALQGIYPTCYLPVYARGSAQPPSGFLHEQEIFDSGRDLRFRLTQNTADIRLSGIGLRTAAPNRLPTEMLLENHAHAVFVNEAFQQRIGDITRMVLTGANGKTLPVTIVPYSLPGDEPWLITTSSVAEKLGWHPNIIAIYSLRESAEEEVRAAYGQIGLRPWFWHQRLPFLQLILYKMGRLFAGSLEAGLLLLTATLALGLLGDLFRELSTLVKMSTLYGVNRTQPVIALLMLAGSYGLALLGVTNLVAYLCHDILRRFFTELQDSFQPFIPQPVQVAVLMVVSIVFVVGLVAWENRRAHHLAEV